MRRPSWWVWALLATWMSSSVARGDEWDQTIQKAKKKEAAEETPEEIARREAKAKPKGESDPTRFFFVASAGAIHAEKTSYLKDPTPVVAAGGAFVFGLAPSWSLRTGLDLVLGPFAEASVSQSTYIGGSYYYKTVGESHVLVGAALNITARYHFSRAVFAGLGGFGAVANVSKVKGHGGGTLEFGVSFGEQRQMEIALRSSLGAGDADLFGYHVVSFGYALGTL